MQAYEEHVVHASPAAPATRASSTLHRKRSSSTLDYYFSILPGVVSGHAAQRFFNIAVEDRSPRCSRSSFWNARTFTSAYAPILDPDRAHLVAYNVTMYERDLALRLGIPIYGADPELALLGTKSGGREVFASARVSYPIGGQDLRSLGDLLNALGEIREEEARPDAGDCQTE